MSYYVLSKNVFGLGRKNADRSMMTGACQYERSYRMEPQQKVYGEKLFDLLSVSREHILTGTELANGNTLMEECEVCWQECDNETV